jgi:release factor glutamine methyltransferase
MAGATALRVAGCEEPGREAAAIVRAVAGVDPRLDPDRDLAPEAARAVASACARRARGEPFARVVGRREFWGLDLVVGPGVFVPRPETELLVECALEHLPPSAPARACDLCTGSGAVALALAHARPGVEVDAVDVAVDAVAAVRHNALRLGVASRVRPRVGDLFSALPRARRGCYDICTCNPPYVDAADWAGLPPEVRDWEPHAALVAAEGWRSLYARLARGALAWLRPGGWLLSETGAGQADVVAGLWRAEGLVHVRARRDLAGIARVLEAARP